MKSAGSRDALWRRVAVSPSHRCRGVALIITLALLALISAMFLGYTASMKTVNAQAKNFGDVTKARQLALGAVDRAISLLGNNTPPRSTTKTWYSGPGSVIETDSATITTEKLYSFVSTSPTVTSDSSPAGINQGDIAPNVGPSGSKYYDGAKINVHWITVGRDGGTPIADTNPLIARYAFWVDDEAAKVNLNYANAQTAANPSAYSTRKIDLRGLYLDNTAGSRWDDAKVTSLCNALYSTACTGTAASPVAASPMIPEKPLETLQELQRATATTTTYDVTKFFGTVYGWDDNKTFYNVLRRDLTNLVAPAAGADDFEDGAISGAPSLYRLMDNYDANTNASPWNLIFPTAAVAAAKNSFTEKYNSTTTSGLKQIIANIRDYQLGAAADSTYIDLTSNVNTALGDARNTPASGVLGLRKTPYINEVAVDAFYTQAGMGPYTITITVKVVVELVNPFEVALGGSYQVEAQMGAQPTLTGGTGLAPTWSAGNTSKSVTLAVGGVAANIYDQTAVITFTATGSSTTSVSGNQTLTLSVDNVKLRAAAGANTIRDFAGNPLQTPFAFSQTCPLTAYAAGNVNMKSVSRNDPRCRYMTAVSAAGAATPGATNGATIVTGYNTTATGTNAVPVIGTQTLPTGISLLADFMPASPDTAMVGATIDASPHWIEEGPMKSIGELGRIHTGYQWRTLRLQPRPTLAGESDALPDWAILDLVRIASIETDDATKTPPNLVRGRININQKVEPSAVCATTDACTGGITVPAIFRQRPLVALVKGWGLATKYDQATAAAGHIDFDVYKYANNTGSWATNNCGSAGFNTIGEICEVDSLKFGLNQGATLGHDAAYEEVIRGIANQITVRSNVFTIWTMAQTIMDANKNGVYDVGVDTITAEQKVQAVVERYESGGAVKFRIKYLKFPDPVELSGGGGGPAPAGCTGNGGACTANGNCCSNNCYNSTKCCIAGASKNSGDSTGGCTNGQSSVPSTECCLGTMSDTDRGPGTSCYCD